MGTPKIIRNDANRTFLEGAEASDIRGDTFIRKIIVAVYYQLFPLSEGIDFRTVGI